jgi:hypothetical protein
VSAYRLLDDGRFAYRKEQLWKNGDENYVGQMVTFRPGDPGARAYVSEITDDEVVFGMLGRPVMDVTCGRLA